MVAVPTCTRRQILDLYGNEVEIFRGGIGPPYLFLHPGQGLWGSAEWLEIMCDGGDVIAPSHPGFGNSHLPEHFSGVDDLALLYLDLLHVLDLKNVIVVGASFGGWIAAAMAIRCTHRMGGLVLIDSLGIKTKPRDVREITDMHAISGDLLAKLLYHSPSSHQIDYTSMSDADLLLIAREQESFAFLGWSPYMHDPKLVGWLHRINIPTLVLWGESDGIVTPEYGRAFSASIPSSEFELVRLAGHLPHIEQPEAIAARVKRFAAEATTPTKR